MGSSFNNLEKKGETMHETSKFIDVTTVYKNCVEIGQILHFCHCVVLLG